LGGVAGKNSKRKKNTFSSTKNADEEDLQRQKRSHLHFIQGEKKTDLKYTIHT